MKFTSAVLALAAMASAAPSPLAIEEQLAALETRTAEETPFALEARQKVAPTNCTTKGVHFILVRGHGGPVTINGKSVPDPNPYNVLRSLGTMITNQIPGSDQLALPYDYNNADEIGGTISGTQLLTSYVKNYVASCPNSKIAMLGYSQGALVVMDTLCGASYFPMFPTLPLDSKYAKNIVAAFTYGDESRAPNQPWDYGTCPVATGFGGFMRWNNAGCNAFKASIRGYCDQEDNFCCTGGNNTGPAHASYVKVYNQDVINFTKQRITATGGQI